MRFGKKNCFRHHRLAQALLATVLSIVIISVYSLYGAGGAKTQTSLMTQAPISKEIKREVQVISLAKEQAYQESRDAYSTHSLPNIPVVSIYADKYTQSEAHMSLPSIKKLIASNYNIKPYEALISAILSNERRYKDSYYVFYHGTDNTWRLPQDLYTQLYAYFNPGSLQKGQDFTFLRFDQDYTSPSVQDFLVTELKNNGLVNDHGDMGAILLSVNLALFGNVGTPSECTWEYFMASRGHLNPDRTVYEKILNAFGLPHTHIKELMSLINLYKTKEQTIIQIFIPKDKVDDIGYVSWIKGIPAHSETMDWIKRNVKNKNFEKTRPAIIALAETFKKEQEHNPIFADLIKQVKENDFSLNDFLHIYRNHPEEIKDINDVMARLIFTPAILLSPTSGVKIFRYSMTTSEQLNQYHKKLNDLINTIIAEKQNSH